MIFICFCRILNPFESLLRPLRGPLIENHWLIHEMVVTETSLHPLVFCEDLWTKCQLNLMIHFQCILLTPYVGNLETARMQFFIWYISEFQEPKQTTDISPQYLIKVFFFLFLGCLQYAFMSSIFSSWLFQTHKM